ncbi:hypothetical protein ACFQZJ_04125 [Maribacter chungangensis]|uniref:Uncharacterized protein n=1 Tax=Maribacter chungangensis TaxID=1069117 RepID=A0ABW3B207_9FLAO
MVRLRANSKLVFDVKVAPGYRDGNDVYHLRRKRATAIRFSSSGVLLSVYRFFGGGNHQEIEDCFPSLYNRQEYKAHIKITDATHGGVRISYCLKE